MILWLSSYPKSGNTFVRALLSSYLNNENEDMFSKMKDFLERVKIKSEKKFYPQN